MKGSIVVAIATGTLVVVAYGGFAMATEPGDPGDPVVAITTTATPAESPDGDASEDDAPPSDADRNGLECVLVETEPPEGEPSEGDPTEPATVTIEQVLEPGAIECGGTGNERSSEVALVPRYLAHSDEFTGAEKGAAISAWAKTHANKKSREDDEEVPLDGDEETSADVAEPSKAESPSPGQSGNAPGHSGAPPGNGNGRGH